MANDDDYSILFQATTHREGKMQTAQVTVSVHPSADLAGHPLGMIILNCQVIKPAEGKETRGYKTFESRCEASWPIDADTDAAMKPFTVTALASSSATDDLEATETFDPKEMHAARFRATSRRLDRKKKK